MSEQSVEEKTFVKKPSLAEAAGMALKFLEANSGRLYPERQPVIKAIREAMEDVVDNTVIPVNHIDNDKADIVYNDENPENPRIICNIPSGKVFWESLPGKGDVPPLTIVIGRTDKKIPVLGALAEAEHAVHMYNDMETIRRMRLTSGVESEASKLKLH